MTSSPADRPVAGAASLLFGEVSEYDRTRGLGFVSSEAGEFSFHATAITDGSRVIEAGAQVAFLVAAAPDGSLEARPIAKLAPPPLGSVSVGPVDGAARNEVLGRLTEAWGEVVVTRGEVIPLASLQFLAARDDEGTLVGAVGFRLAENSMEVVTMNAFLRRRGVGTALLRRAAEEARAAGAWRLFLTTTDANIPAIAFYLHCGLRMAALHENALGWAREVKPSIPTASGGVPLRDEIEFELLLDEEGSAPRPRASPRS